MNSETKICQNCKGKFTVDGDDLSFYEKFEESAPDYCPACRMQRRLAHRNERTLYKRECDLCGKDSVTIYPPNTPWPVYCAPCWWSDKWDARIYGIPYDPSRPFFEQFRELQMAVPRIGLLNMNSVNSEYTNNSADNKNCYLIFAAEKNEDCLYGRLIQNCKSVIDGAFVYDSELCYEAIDCHKCYQTMFSEQCQASTDLLFCYDVRDSDHCILSVGLRHKSYAFENKGCSKEELERKKREILSSASSIAAAKRRLEELKQQYPVKFASQTKCVKTTGDYLYNCHTSRMLFDTRNAKNCGYIADAEDPIDSLDCNNVYYKPELCLDIMGTLQSYHLRHSAYIFYSHDMEYCDNCHSSESCFGGVGLRKAKYSILNKEYSKEEYKRIRGQIIEALKREGMYGAFLPPSVSPFGYNETLAKDYWPLTKEQAIAEGFQWQGATTGMVGKETILRGKIPETIEEVGDSILNEVLVCLDCGRNFRITPSELQFYRRMHLPLPRKDFECRHQDRMRKRTPRALWHRKCQCAGGSSENGAYRNSAGHFHASDHCLNEFETSYAPERPEIVYCESCYNSEVV